MTDAEKVAYRQGMIYGLTKFAWWKDGTTLADAIKELRIPAEDTDIETAGLYVGGRVPD